MAEDNKPNILQRLIKKAFDLESIVQTLIADSIILLILGYINNPESYNPFENMTLPQGIFLIVIFFLSYALFFSIKRMVGIQTQEKFNKEAENYKKNVNSLSKCVSEIQEQVPENLKEQLDIYSKERANEEIRQTDLLRILIDLIVCQVKFNKYMRSGSYESADRENIQIDTLINELRAHKRDDIVRIIIAKRILNQ